MIALRRNADLEPLDIRNIGEVYERMKRGDVRYRFAIDMATLEGAKALRLAVASAAHGLAAYRLAPLSRGTLGEGWVSFFEGATA